MNVAKARQLITAQADVTAAPHFDREAFRAGGAIFATLRKDGVLNVKLSREVQDMLCSAEPAIFQAVAGGWGRMGWTTIDIGKAGETELRSALQAAWTLSREKKPKAAKKKR
jgi:hypothetical protein